MRKEVSKSRSAQRFAEINAWMRGINVRRLALKLRFPINERTAMSKEVTTASRHKANPRRFFVMLSTLLSTTAHGQNVAGMQESTKVRPAIFSPVYASRCLIGFTNISMNTVVLSNFPPCLIRPAVYHNVLSSHSPGPLTETLGSPIACRPVS